MIKLYWHKEGTATWRLLAEPAAICFTLIHLKNKWEASCLGEKLELGDVSLKDAQFASLAWFQKTLTKLGRIVADLHSQS